MAGPLHVESPVALLRRAMARFEYSILDFHDLNREMRQAQKSGQIAKSVDIRQYLEIRWNAMGAEGWELVGVGTGAVLGTTMKAHYYFKRATK